MESIFAYIDKKYGNRPDVVGVIAVERPDRSSPLIGGFDILLLIIVERANQTDTIHYIKDKKHIQERWLGESELRRLFIAGEQRFMLNWLLEGEICLDKQGRLRSYRSMLLSFPDSYRERKLIVEFSNFLESFLQSRHYLEEENILDAYSNVHECLIHWARIIITEAGFHSEVTVWNQVKHINLGVYKIYEELTTSHESLEQRIRLVLLACDFSVMSKIKSCCQPLLRVMGERDKPWTVDELMRHKELYYLPIDLSLLLRKLVERSLVAEIPVQEVDEGIEQIGYFINSR